MSLVSAAPRARLPEVPRIAAEALPIGTSDFDMDVHAMESEGRST